NGTESKWEGKNALAVAARHHDSTGHTTWCEQTISVRYGPDVLVLIDQEDKIDDQ
ncbi:hypothetical protein LCGC14_2357180, partial [marine sediment metagenome]